jgi:hypothetical protein
MYYHHNHYVADHSRECLLPCRVQQFKDEETVYEASKIHDELTVLHGFKHGAATVSIDNLSSSQTLLAVRSFYV